MPPPLFGYPGVLSYPNISSDEPDSPDMKPYRPMQGFDIPLASPSVFGYQQSVKPLPFSEIPPMQSP